MFRWIDLEEETYSKKEFATRKEAIEDAIGQAEEIMELAGVNVVEGLVIVEVVEIINVTREYSSSVDSTFVKPEDTPYFEGSDNIGN